MCKKCKELFENEGATNPIELGKLVITEHKDHDFGAYSHDYENQALHADVCALKGTVAAICAICDQTDVELCTEHTKSSHVWTKGEKIPATCKTTGTQAYTCSLCNESETKTLEIDPNNHDYSIEVEGTAKEATCTAKGKEADKKCSRCEAVQTGKEIEIDPNNHTNVEGTEAKAATCTEAGNDEYWYCGGCKKYFEDKECTTAITDISKVTRPATGHDFENSKDYLHDSTQHWKKCKNCDAGEENKKENHTGINKCDICGYEKTYTVTYNVMRYGVRDDVEITGYLCKKDGSYSDKITDDQFRKGDTGLQENEIKKVSTTGNEITFNGVTAGNYVLVILGDERTRSTRVAFVVDGDNISRQAKLYLFGDVNGDGDLTEEDVEKFMDVVVGNSICDDTIQAALGYRVQGRPKAVDITNARRIMGV